MSCESEERPHLIERLDRVARAHDGLSRDWRFDRMVVSPSTGKVSASFAAVANSSAHPGAGKTMITVGLARSVAGSGSEPSSAAGHLEVDRVVAVVVTEPDTEGAGVVIQCVDDRRVVARRHVLRHYGAGVIGERER